MWKQFTEMFYFIIFLLDSILIFVTKAWLNASLLREGKGALEVIHWRNLSAILFWVPVANLIKNNFRNLTFIKYVYDVCLHY